MFRDLKADEIDVRIAQATENGVSLLLYKDARVDQDILDETVGPMNWKREHTRENANCIVSIWDKEKQQWIPKEDTGTESNTEKEKGLASDSFKRACVNWGIGRELYTAPFIWVNSSDLKTLKQEGSHWKCRDTFRVQKVVIEGKAITGLEILNERTKRICFLMGGTTTEETTVQMDTVEDAANYKLTFGKHSGKTLGEIFKTDRKYLEWLHGNEKTDQTIKKGISILVQAAIRTQQERRNG